MATFEILEGAMLVCFSISWYWSIMKMLQTKQASGKSLNFVLMICTGYLFGIGSKLLAWDQGAEMSLLVWVYAWNFMVTVCDAGLVVRYSARAKTPREAPRVVEARPEPERPRRVTAQVADQVVATVVLRRRVPA